MRLSRLSDFDAGEKGTCLLAMAKKDPTNFLKLLARCMLTAADTYVTADLPPFMVR